MDYQLFEQDVYRRQAEIRAAAERSHLLVSLHASRRPLNPSRQLRVVRLLHALASRLEAVAARDA